MHGVATVIHRLTPALDSYNMQYTFTHKSANITAHNSAVECITASTCLANTNAFKYGYVNLAFPYLELYNAHIFCNALMPQWTNCLV